MADSIVGIVDWILKMFLYYIIPFSITFTIIALLFETLKPDTGKVKDGNYTFVKFFKDVLRIFSIGLIAWVAIFVVRTLLPAAGTTIVEGVGF